MECSRPYWVQGNGQTSLKRLSFADRERPFFGTVFMLIQKWPMFSSRGPLKGTETSTSLERLSLALVLATPGDLSRRMHRRYRSTHSGAVPKWGLSRRPAHSDPPRRPRGIHKHHDSNERIIPYDGRADDLDRSTVHHDQTGREIGLKRLQSEL